MQKASCNVDRTRGLILTPMSCCLIENEVICIQNFPQKLYFTHCKAIILQRTNDHSPNDVKGST